MITIQELEGKIENEQINFDAQLAHKLKVSYLHCLNDASALHFQCSFNASIFPIKYLFCFFNASLLPLLLSVSVCQTSFLNKFEPCLMSLFWFKVLITFYNLLFAQFSN